jgi:hypothetical protein
VSAHAATAGLGVQIMSVAVTKVESAPTKQIERVAAMEITLQ